MHVIRSVNATQSVLISKLFRHRGEFACLTLRYRHANVDGFNIFYREAVRAQSQNCCLFARFPSSSHMFRDLIPLLSDHFHIIAPDLPGFGLSDMPSREQFKYNVR